MATESRQQSRTPSYYFSTRDLVTIAILSALGGVLSTYIGYLGNLINRVLGVPFGAGQFMAGLHIFWLILAWGLVLKPGAGTLAGILKGLVEMLTGSTHGAIIVLVSGVAGLIVDLVMWLAGRRSSLPAYTLAGGLASASNVVVFQLLFLRNVPPGYIFVLLFLAFVSGFILAGYFGDSVLQVLAASRVVRIPAAKAPSRGRWALVAVLTLALTAGAIYYYTQVFEPFWGGPTASIEGVVESPYTYDPRDFDDAVKTVNAELKGQVTYVPPQDYTGVPLHLILERARPRPEAAAIHVIASDGYEVEFELGAVMSDGEMILIQEDDTLRLVAAHYEGGYWVRQVSRIVVE